MYSYSPRHVISFLCYYILMSNHCSYYFLKICNLRTFCFDNYVVKMWKWGPTFELFYLFMSVLEIFYRSFLLLNVFKNYRLILLKKGHFVYLLYKEIPNNFIRHIRRYAFTFPQKLDSRKYVSFTSTSSISISHHVIILQHEL